MSARESSSGGPDDRPDDRKPKPEGRPVDQMDEKLRPQKLSEVIGQRAPSPNGWRSP